MHNKRIGFILNPIAGAGGRLGLKGSDGLTYDKILSMNAKLWSPRRAKLFLSALKKFKKDLFFLTSSSPMGSDLLKDMGFEYEIVYHPKSFNTSSEDTIRAARIILKKKPCILVFIGGDGTARDIVKAIDMKIPTLGIPAGVKMYSGVFAATPEDGALTLVEFLKKRLEVIEAEVLDIDENVYRRDVLSIKLYGYLKVPRAPGMILQGKTPTSIQEYEEQLSIAKWVTENMDNEALYILGPGTTTKAIANYLKQPKTLLGVDVYKGKKLLAKDVNAKKLSEIVDSHSGEVYIVVSPIGSQGFIFGRGNLQIPPDIILRAGKKGIIIVATKSKLLRLKELKVDSGDSKVDKILSGYHRVITGYNEEYIMKISRGLLK